MVVSVFRAQLVWTCVLVMWIPATAFAYGSILIEKGDGASDDTDRIHAVMKEAAKTNRGVVFDGTGTYRVRGLYLYPGTFPKFIDGRGAQIQAVDGRTVGSTLYFDKVPPGFYLRNIIIDGNPQQLARTSIAPPADSQCNHSQPSAQADYGITIRGGKQFSLEQITIRNHNKAGLLLLGKALNPVEQSLFKSLYIRNNGTGVAAVSVEAGHLIRDNTFLDTNVAFSSGEGLRFFGVSDLRWIGGAIENSGSHGALIEDSRQIDFRTYLENYGGWKQYQTGRGNYQWCPRNAKHHAFAIGASCSRIFYRGRIESEENRTAGALLNTNAADIECLEVLSAGKRLFTGGCSFPQMSILEDTIRHHYTTEAPDYISVENYPRLSGDVDDTERIERANTDAVNARKGLRFGNGRVYSVRNLSFGIQKDAIGRRTSNTVPKYIDGRRSTLVFVGDSGDVIRIENPHGNRYSTNFSLRNLTIYGNSTADTGLKIVGMQRSIVADVDIKNAKTGLELQGSNGHGIYYNLFENISIHYSKKNGMTLKSLHPWDWKMINGNTFNNLQVGHSQGSGVAIDGASSNVFIPSHESQRNYLVENGDALTLNNVSDLEIINGHIHSLRKTALQIQNRVRGVYLSGGHLYAPTVLSGAKNGCGFLLNAKGYSHNEYCR